MVFDYPYALNTNNKLERLKSKWIPPEVITMLINSGYYYNPLYEDSYICDSLYGLNCPIHLDIINDLVQKKGYEKKETRTAEISSLKEGMSFFKKFSAKINPELMERFTFRGVNKEYYIKREFPNPFISNSQGFEISLIPSFWRIDENLVLRSLAKYPEHSPSIFRTIYADPIIYKGIDVQSLTKRNIDKYGYHTISDLEDFPDAESQEYYKRYFQHKIVNHEGVLLEQHYGMPTCGIDLTFDLATAISFALFQYNQNQEGKVYSKYNPNSEAAVYGLMVPGIKSSEDMVQEIELFKHLPPIRPLKQKCTLSCQDTFSINEAAFHIVFKLKLHMPFDITGIPKPQELFPSPNEDLFYKELLEQKKNNPSIWGNIIEYDL